MKSRFSIEFVSAGLKMLFNWGKNVRKSCKSKGQKELQRGVKNV